MSIIEFKTNANMQSKFADRDYTLDNIGSAMEHIREAIKLNPKPSLYLRLAELYCNVGALHVANQVLVNMRKVYPDNIDALIGLFRIALSVGNKSGAEQYCRDIVSKQKVLDPSYSEGIEVRQVPTSLRDRFKIYSYGKETLDKARDMIPEDIQGALALLYTIDKRDDKYIEAKECIALCKLIIDDKDGAYGECLDIVAIDKSNVTALTMLVSIANSREDKDEVQEYSDRLAQIKDKISDIERIKVAYAMCESGRHGDARDILDKDKDHCFDPELMYMRGAAHYNSGDRDKGIRILLELRRLYGDVGAVSESLDMCVRGEDKIPYINRESISSMLSKKTTISLLLQMKEDEFLKAIDDKATKRAIEWYLRLASEKKEVGDLVERIAYGMRNDSFVPFVQELFTDTTIDDDIKRMLLANLIFDERVSEMWWYIDDRLTRISVQYPSGFDKLHWTLRSAYAIALSFTLSDVVGAERELYEVLKKLTNLIRGKESEIHSDTALAGVMLLMCNGSGYPATPNDVRDVLHVSVKTLKKYCDILGVNLR